MADKYDFTPEMREKILDAIKKRLLVLRCPLCDHDVFTIVEGFVSPPIYRNYWLDQKTSGLPSVALVCETCGNTLFINMGALGLGNLVSPSQEELKKLWGLK